MLFYSFIIERLTESVFNNILSDVGLIRVVLIDVVESLSKSKVREAEEKEKRFSG